MQQCQATEDNGALQCALYDGHKSAGLNDGGHSWASRVDTWEAALERVTTLCTRIATQRHRKYGPENIKATGEVGLWVRMTDKLARISRAMTTGEMDFEDEKFEDAIVDIVNYGRFWLMWRAGQWELPAQCLDEEPGCPTCGVAIRGGRTPDGCQDAWHLGAIRPKPLRIVRDPRDG